MIFTIIIILEPQSNENFFAVRLANIVYAKNSNYPEDKTYKTTNQKTEAEYKREKKINK
jgi:hypothetical protein